MKQASSAPGNLHCIVYFVLGAWLTFFAVKGSWSPETVVVHAKAVAPPRPPDSNSEFAAGPGGTLEAIQIPFSNPDGSFPDRESRLRKATWTFNNWTESDVLAFFASCDLRLREHSLLSAKEFWQTTANRIVISPPDELIWSLSPNARRQIYSVLGTNSDNYSQHLPFRFSPPSRLDQVLRHSGLRARSLEDFRRLCYTNDNSLYFVDLQALHEALAQDEFNEVASLLCTVPAYLLKLRIDPDSDVDALIRYWGKGGRRHIIAPLLKSISHVEGGTTVNIATLLPPYARLHLYTFPEEGNGTDSPRQDCTFAALNFFNNEPDAKLFDTAYREKVLNTDYDRVSDDPQFGDVITMLDSQNHVFHACVYVANGFVFTKNGINSRQPWILMKIQDMLDTYEPIEKSWHLVFLRHKAFDKNPSLAAAPPSRGS